MSYTPFHTADGLMRFIAQSQNEQLIAALPQFSIQELAESFVLLQNEEIQNREGKMIALFEFIDASEQLEALGKNLSVQQFLHLLDFLVAHDSYQNTLSTLLIGLRSEIFCKALNFFQSGHLALFKEEGKLEPLHYHLTQFVHEGESLYQHIDRQIERFEESLQTIGGEELTVERLENLVSQISPFRNKLLDCLERISVALSIAWNTDRIDLIEKLSGINEALQRLLVLFIGHPASDNLPSTGLYLRIEQILSTIFDSSLKDEDASIEGLTRLSVWHLKDYWELGLFPHIHQLEELDLDAAQPEGKQREVRHQHLFSHVQQQLERLKIGTVGDLKREHLFSKPLLKAYIDRNRNLLLI